MRVGFIGCVDSSRMALDTLLKVPGLDVVAVVTRESSSVNADFCNLTDLCIDHDIPYHFEEPKQRQLSTEFLRQFNLDVIFCVGWSYLLDEEALSIAPCGVIGFHPAKLPQNRGRHPIIWALALGLTETASTFFRMDSGADSGPIVSQQIIKIDSQDDAASLYSKILVAAQAQIENIGLDLVANRAQFVEQDHSQATYWRKRTRKDGLIDFRMSAVAIHNLVRALAPPYPGAEFQCDDEYVTVKSSQLLAHEYPENIEPGRIIDTTSDSIVVKASGREAIKLTIADSKKFKIGQYL